jgi:hypothetical protein
MQGKAMMVCMSCEVCVRYRSMIAASNGKAAQLRFEDITQALWGPRLSASTVSDPAAEPTSLPAQETDSPGRRDGSSTVVTLHLMRGPTIVFLPPRREKRAKGSRLSSRRRRRIGIDNGITPGQITA